MILAGFLLENGLQEPDNPTSPGHIEPQRDGRERPREDDERENVKRDEDKRRRGER